MIGQNIKKIRAFKEMTASELADSANMNESTLSKIETGKASPNTRTLQKIADALGVEISLLYARDLHLSDQVPLFKTG
jgi:transcriptional regulator with XRE-family HTH domain